MLHDLGSEINATHPTFAKELGLPIRPADVEAQKIDSSTLDIFKIVAAAFSVMDKAHQVRFFEETFLVANVSPKVVFGMPFLILNGANVDFLVRELQWRTYTTEKALSTTKYVKLIGKKEFTAAALDSKYKIYIVHIKSISSVVLPSSFLLDTDIHPSRRSQVSSLIADKAPTKVSAEYLDFADIFSPDLASKLPKHIGINNHAIE